MCIKFAHAITIIEFSPLLGHTLAYIIKDSYVYLEKIFSCIKRYLLCYSMCESMVTSVDGVFLLYLMRLTFAKPFWVSVQCCLEVDDHRIHVLCFGFTSQFKRYVKLDFCISSSIYICTDEFKLVHCNAIIITINHFDRICYQIN